MGKRIVLIFLVLIMVSTGTMAFARTGVGIAAGAPIIAGLPGSNVMLSLKVDSIPLLLGIGMSARNDNFSLGFTGDYWIANRNLIDFINWYVGIGGYVGLGLGNNTNIDLGARIPIGINAFLLDRVLEVFFEVAPTIGVGFVDSGVNFPRIGAQAAIGFRIWF